MPIVDDGAVRPQRGVYEAVRASIQADLANYRGAYVVPPGALEGWLPAMNDGRAVAIPANYLPDSARPRLAAGQSMPTAVVSPDDRVTFRAETGQELLERLGV